MFDQILQVGKPLQRYSNILKFTTLEQGAHSFYRFQKKIINLKADNLNEICQNMYIELQYDQNFFFFKP